jgi:(2R)-3-sulfolactate dehydrogenase (NADP+)
MQQLSLTQAIELSQRALERAGAKVSMAKAAAEGLVRAEAQGLASHGLIRTGQYVAHLRNGRVNGAAIPTVLKKQTASILIDANEGLAFEPCALAVQQAMAAAKAHGVCMAGVCRSHHAGVLVDFLRPVAQASMVGFAFSNSPAAMPVAGGKHPILGTNPMAAVFPRQEADPLLIDMSLSEVARGKLMVAAKTGKPIPQGWALDASGQPTTDPQAGLSGMMLALGGGAKGATLALMVELLVAALLGSQFGFEASSFFQDEGNAPRLGQAFLVIDPEAFAGTSSFARRIEVIISEMLIDEGVRLPGARRLQLEKLAHLNGLEVNQELYQQLQKLANSD